MTPDSGYMTPDLRNYTHLLFDADGTLFDFDKAEGTALQETLQHYGVACTSQMRDWYREINQTLWLEYEQSLVSREKLQYERFARLLDRIGQPGDPVSVNQTYLAALGRCTFLLEGALELCQSLAQRYHLAIITNGLAAVQHPRFRLSALSSIISDVFVSEDIGSQKPQPAYFEHVLQRLGIDDRRVVLVIGDSLSADIQGGINAGLDTCWYNPARASLPPGIRPTYQVSSLAALAPAATAQDPAGSMA